MKIKPEHFKHIETAMLSVLKDGKFQNIAGNPTILEAIELTKKDLLSHRRMWHNLATVFMYNWFNSVIASYWVRDVIYPYANDSHLETALKQIIIKAEPQTKDLLK